MIKNVYERLYNDIIETMYSELFYIRIFETPIFLLLKNKYFFLFITSY